MNENLETNANLDGGEGGNEAAWLSSVPENLRGNEAFKGIEKSSDAWQQFVDMKVNSETAVQIPGESATDEDRAAFLNKLGRPENAVDYTITKPDSLPEDMPYDDKMADVFKGVFHEIGLSDVAANQLWGKFYEIAAQGHKADQEKTNDAVNSLKDEWAGEKFKVNTEVAHRAFAKTFEDEKQQAEATEFIESAKIDGVPLGNHPMFLKIFAQIGSVIGDDSANAGRGDGIESGLTDEDAAKKRFPNTDFK